MGGGSAFTGLDWAVVAAYLVFTTWLGAKLSGKQQTIRDYFLGGRRLPWYAVSGSIVASEISGVTFVSVPAIAWAQGGDYSYLMLAVGSIAARAIIGFWLVPAYYEQEIYSPYEFMAKRLGPALNPVATGIFILGGFLAQGARLFLAALVLDAITGLGLGACVIVIAAVSVVWTWIGGITSVVWTDVMQFVILLAGALVALAAAIQSVPGGWDGVVAVAEPAGKFRLWNFSLDPGARFTFWCGLFGTTFLNVGALGTDQMMAQRLFCCRDPKEARKAILWSTAGIVIAPIMTTVGVAIFAYFNRFPMTPAEAGKVAEWKDYVFPLFILRAMPEGVRGLLFAAIFAAATATSTLAAMAQTGLTAFVRPLMKGEPSEARLLWISRLLVLAAAVGLGSVAMLCGLMRTVYKDILDLALAMAAYTYGAMLGILLLALLPLRRDGRGLLWGVPFSILTVFALNWQHHVWAQVLATVAAFATVVTALPSLAGDWRKLRVALVGFSIVMGVVWIRLPGDGWNPDYLKIAWPWHYPIGCGITLGIGIAAGNAYPVVPKVVSSA